jgi:small subunit ribosomal protein S6
VGEVMRNYEGVFIIDPDLSHDASKNVIAQIQEWVTKVGGRVDSMQEWGKKRLTYKIRKKQDGNYLFLQFQIDPKHTKKLEQTIKLNDQVMRYLLVNKDDK